MNSLPRIVLLLLSSGALGYALARANILAAVLGFTLSVVIIVFVPKKVAGVVGTPHWLRQRMKLLREKPKPAIEKVIQQMEASAKHRKTALEDQT